MENTTQEDRTIEDRIAIWREDDENKESDAAAVVFLLVDAEQELRVLRPARDRLLDGRHALRIAALAMRDIRLACMDALPEPEREKLAAALIAADDALEEEIPGPQPGDIEAPPKPTRKRDERVAYVVRGKTGEYDGAFQWDVGFYFSETKAAEHAKAANDLFRGVAHLMHESPQKCWGNTEAALDELRKSGLDPEPSYQYPSTDYEVVQVPRGHVR